MTTLLFTTVRRHSPIHEPSGYLYAVDWTCRRVLRKTPIIEPPFREHDRNARGGIRGGKGISFDGDEVCLANASCVIRFDPKWRPIGGLSHPSCAGIHDVEHRDGTIWVTSARNDLVFQFHPDGRVLRQIDLKRQSPAHRSLGWRPRVLMSDDDLLNGTIDFTDPRTHDLETFDAAHVNSLCFLPDGDMLVSLGIVWGRLATLFRLKRAIRRVKLWDAFVAANKALQQLLGLDSPMHSQLVMQPATGRSAVLRIRRDGTITLVAVLPGTSVPSHSLRTQPDGTVLYLNTSAGAVVRLDPADGAILSQSPVTRGFLRGMTNLSDSTVILGSKNELLLFDVPRRELLADWQYSAETDEAVYDVKVLPPHFELPPTDFAAADSLGAGIPTIHVSRAAA